MSFGSYVMFYSFMIDSYSFILDSYSLLCYVVLCFILDRLLY